MEMRFSFRRTSPDNPVSSNGTASIGTKVSIGRHPEGPYPVLPASISSPLILLLRFIPIIAIWAKELGLSRTDKTDDEG